MNQTGEDAIDLLRRLVGIPLSTPTRHSPNTVLAVQPPHVLVATGKHPDGQPVPIQEVQEGLDRLLEAAEIDIHPDTLGYRSSFIGAVLLRLPGAVLIASTPPRIRLTEPAAQETRRPLVVIHPSGSPIARRHWHDTMDNEVQFVRPPFSEALLADQLEALNALHPSGTARFWGATGNQDRNMQRLSPGDVVLFTWSKAVRAVGEIGVLFQNAGFADLLWTPDERNGSYRNVYSLRSLQAVEIPYEEIWALPGFTAGDMFMGLRILSDERADIVMQAFGITTAAAAEQESVLEKAVAGRLAHLLGTVVPAESVHTSQSSYQQTEQTRLVRRNESLLLQAYRQSLGQAAGTRLKVDTGWTDFYIEHEDDAELLEAKGSADHEHARQALAQLLDYRRFTRKPATSLTALFPERPSQHSIRLLHDYDVNCVYLDDNGAFVRLPAAG